MEIILLTDKQPMIRKTEENHRPSYYTLINLLSFVSWKRCINDAKEHTHMKEHSSIMSALCDRGRVIAEIHTHSIIT